MELVEKISSALLELKQASLSLQRDANECTWHELMDRYDMLFLGEKFNTIYGIELRHTLSRNFGVDISMEDLIALIPNICASLHMNIKPLVLLENAGKPDAPIAEYSIELF